MSCLTTVSRRECHGDISSENDAKEGHGLLSSWYFRDQYAFVICRGRYRFSTITRDDHVTIIDLSLLAWEHEIKDNPIPHYDLLATLPSQFGACSNISRRHATILRTPNCLVTHDGVQIQLPVVFNNK